MKHEFSPLNLNEPPLDGVNLIEASAGTGKTYAICAIVMHLLMGKNIPIEKILVVTFTVAATEELKGRIRSMLRKLYEILHAKDLSPSDKDYELMHGLLERYGGKPQAIDALKTALRDFDRASIFTIHGFCQRMLMEYAFESSSLFDTELIPNPDILIDEAAKDFWRKKMYCAGEAFVHYATMNDFYPNMLSALAKNRPLDPDMVILPDMLAFDETKIEESYMQLKLLFDELKKIWDASEEEIRSLIETAIAEKKLNGNKYQNKYMNGRIEEMKSFFLENDVLSTHYSKITYFSSSLLNEETTAISHPFCQKLDDFLVLRDKLLNELSNYLLCLKKEFLQNIELFLSRPRQRTNVRTFNDLLTVMYRELNGNSDSQLALRIRTRFHAALIDEFQDTDPLQYEIFSIVFSNHCPLYLIGDPKQAIYKFRGADIFAYLRASSQCNRRLTLSKNYRSHPNLVCAINAIFGKHTGSSNLPFVIDGIAYNPVESSLNERDVELVNMLPEGSKLTIWYIKDNTNRANDEKPVTIGDLEDIISILLVKEIHTLMKYGIDPKEMAILVRKNSQSKFLARKLRTHGIPCVTYGTESVLETDEAIEMERLITSIAEPSHRGYLVAALSTDFFSLTASKIANIINSEKELSSYFESFKRYREIWEQHGFMTMFRRLMQDKNIPSRLASLDDGERRLTNVFHIAELIHRVEKEHSLGVDGILKWFSEEKSVEADEIKLRLETDEYAVKIITIHKSKGLEFPIVFAPYLYDSAKKPTKEYVYHAPSESGKMRTVLNLSSDKTNRPQALLEELSESVRLMYVALTRAKVRCYTLWGNINKSELSAPMYVFHRHRFSSPKEFIENNNKKSTNLSTNMLHDMHQLEIDSENAVLIQEISEADLNEPERKKDEKKLEEPSPALNCRIFTNGTIVPPWILTSFSSLTYNTREDFSEKVDEEGEGEKETDGREFSIHSFPRGTRAGLFIHKVFESINFQNFGSAESQSLIKELLRAHGIDESWSQVICKNVQSVLNHPLKDETSTFCLAEINPSMRVHELEFYFPASKLSARKLAELIIGNDTDIPESIPISYSKLGIDENRGFVRGFIDLVFTIHGKWFIVDWKSNHLGDSTKSYLRKNLENAMLEKHYYLQYHLYAIALHRHLARTLTGYRYKSHFGGIFYIFVRGIDAESPHSGVFFKRPSELLINTLDDYLGR